MLGKNSLERMQIMFLTDLDLNVMMDLLSGSDVYTQHVKKQVTKMAESIEADVNLSIDEKQSQLEFLSDDIYYAEQAQELAEELALIGLSKTLEIRIYKAAAASKLFSKTKLKELYRTEKFIKHFEDVGINVESILHFDKFNELKLINNCIKHSGDVSQPLADLDSKKWIVGNKISNCEFHFRALLEPNIMFLNNLGTTLRSTLAI
jgi:hypothetical protein